MITLCQSVRKTSPTFKLAQPYIIPKEVFDHTCSGSVWRLWTYLSSVPSCAECTPPSLENPYAQTWLWIWRGQCVGCNVLLWRWYIQTHPIDETADSALFKRNALKTHSEPALVLEPGLCCCRLTLIERQDSKKTSQPHKNGPVGAEPNLCA